MHEMGIANSVLDAVRAEANKYPGSRPSRVGLRVGEWSGVDRESLEFCFEALVMGSDLAGLSVEIDYRKRRNRCDRCQLEFGASDYEYSCPQCGSDATTPVGGMELDIAFVELEE